MNHLLLDRKAIKSYKFLKKNLQVVRNFPTITAEDEDNQAVPNDSSANEVHIVPVAPAAWRSTWRMIDWSTVRDLDSHGGAASSSYAVHGGAAASPSSASVSALHNGTASSSSFSVQGSQSAQRVPAFVFREQAHQNAQVYVQRGISRISCNGSRCFLW